MAWTVQFVELVLLAFIIPSVLSYQLTRHQRHSGRTLLEAGVSSDHRRKVLLLCTVSLPPLVTAQRPANAGVLFFGDSNDNSRRDLDVCLVTVQRVVYWAERQGRQLQEALATATTAATSNVLPKTLYVEARLGAKAALTGKSTGGSGTATVYTLAGLQLAGCLTDIEWYAKKQLPKQEARAVGDLVQSFTEGLAAVVEFDGLETLTDPSPRSSLTLAQYTDAKASFVVRALTELIVPTGNRLMRSFGPEPLGRSKDYVQQYYMKEIP